MNKAERAFDRVAQRLQLNPSRWVPHLKPTGIYEMGTSYPDGKILNDKGELAEGEPVPIECFSIYGVFWTICYNRRKDTDRKASRWENIWSFLSDVDMGIYDTTAWVKVDESPDSAHFVHEGH